MMGQEEAASAGRFACFLAPAQKKPNGTQGRRAPCICLARGRNQAREPRRRRHPPAPARDTRETGTRRSASRRRREWNITGAEEVTHAEDAKSGKPGGIP